MPQLTKADCGVAVLATFAGVSYEQALSAIARVDPEYVGHRGLHNRQIVQAAKFLKVKPQLRLQPTRRFDLDTDAGILRVRFAAIDRTNAGGHFVAVIGGNILCPVDARPQPWREYLAGKSARACTLLREIQQ